MFLLSENLEYEGMSFKPLRQNSAFQVKLVGKGTGLQILKLIMLISPMPASQM